MIEKLLGQIQRQSNGDGTATIVMLPPSNAALADKLNEIIDAVNRLDSSVMHQPGSQCRICGVFIGSTQLHYCGGSIQP